MLVLICITNAVITADSLALCLFYSGLSPPLLVTIWLKVQDCMRGHEQCSFVWKI